MPTSFCKRATITDWATPSSSLHKRKGRVFGDLVLTLWHLDPNCILMLFCGPCPQYSWDSPEEIPVNSGKTPETLSERFLEFPSRVRLGSPKPYNSRHLRLPHFQNSLPSIRLVTPLFSAGHGIPISTEGISDFALSLIYSLTLRSSRTNKEADGKRRVLITVSSWLHLF